MLLPGQAQSCGSILMTSQLVPSLPISRYNIQNKCSIRCNHAGRLPGYQAADSTGCQPVGAAAAGHPRPAGDGARFAGAVCQRVGLFAAARGGGGAPVRAARGLPAARAARLCRRPAWAARPPGGAGGGRFAGQPLAAR